MLADKTVRIATPVNPLVVMPDDAGDLCVVLDVGKDALADYGMLLHLPAFFKGQRSWLLKQTWGQADLSDVMNEPAEMS